jgi:hypothetical protein
MELLMRLTTFLKRFLKQGATNNDQGQARIDEQRDRSGMADFVRIFQNQDSNRSS